MKEQLSHVQRQPLPWRANGLTECGLDVTKYGPTLTRDELTVKVKAQGKTRAAMSVCMTCWQRAERYFQSYYRWDEELSPLEREIQSARHDKSPLVHELKAIGILVDRHRDEFNELVEDIRVTVPIAVKGRVQ